MLTHSKNRIIEFALSRLLQRNEFINSSKRDGVMPAADSQSDASLVPINRDAFWLSSWRMSERLQPDMTWKYLLQSKIAKRHFGYQADERLKPKCPFGALR